MTQRIRTRIGVLSVGVIFVLLACRHTNLSSAPDADRDPTTAAAKRLLAEIPADLRAAPPAAPDQSARQRFGRLVDAFGHLHPPAPPARLPRTASRLEKLTNRPEWFVPADLETIRAILREGPVDSHAWPSAPRDVKNASMLMHMMPEPLWVAGVKEAVAGDSHAAAADFILAVRYCRATMPTIMSNFNGWASTVSAIRECAENHKLDPGSCKILLQELPAASSAKNAVAERFKLQLAENVARVANIEVPYSKFRFQGPGGEERALSPCGTLDREASVQLLIDLARDDVRNALGSKATYSNASVARAEHLKAKLPPIGDLDNPTATEAAFQHAADAFARGMNASPNSIGLWLLPVNGKYAFTMDWLFEDQLDKTRQALTAVVNAGS